MATSTESNPPANDSKGLSSLDELNLEKSILRRGLATAREIEACKAHRAKLTGSDASKSLLDIMVEAKFLTKNQSIRVLKEIGETNRKFEVPGYQILEKIGKGSMGVVFKARQESVDRIVAVKILLDALAQNKEFIKLIHRDAKPENVILTRDGNVKLADLGLARLTADEKWAMSEAGMAIGTPYYISPEQVRGQIDVDIRADIYGLGATLYHMITGRVPYSGETPTEVMKKHVDRTTLLTPPDHLNTKLSSGLGEVVETMMAKNRENRYRSPEDLILDLKCLLQGESPMIAA